MGVAVVTASAADQSPNHSDGAVHRLIKHKMLAYDGEDTEQPTDADLIKITPSGYIHLRSLPHFIEYLSS